MPSNDLEVTSPFVTTPEPPGGVRTWSMANIATDGHASWPDRAAVVDSDGSSLSYRELYARSYQVAQRLLALNVGPGDRVAVAGTRNADTLVAIFGICMAGATYVPLDPTQPSARLSALLQDADVRGLIGPRAVAEASALGARFFSEIEGLARAPEAATSSLRELPLVLPDEVAYIMYTSGSTGMPKGVQIEQRSVRAFFETHNERAKIEAGDRCLNSSPFYFDVSLMDVFLPLYVGGTVYFGSELPLPRLALRAIEQHRITHFYAVGTVLAMITGDGSELERYDLSSLRLLLTGAEVCNVSVVNQWLRRCPRLGFLNSYGPTEATVGCISFVNPQPGELAEASCPIGAPHRRSEVLLLGDHGAPIADPGLVGELLLGGEQLMRGYFRRPLEDARAFIWLDGKRYYRTGDYASRDRHGNFRFVGRRDDEIKLNGHRIHLNEVLRCISDGPRVEAAVAGVIPDPRGERMLGTAVVTNTPVTHEIAAAIQRHVASLLPGAMQPRRWAFLQAFPRLSSGKIDREACFSRLSRAIAVADARFYVQTGDELQPLVCS